MCVSLRMLPNSSSALVAGLQEVLILIVISIAIGCLVFWPRSMAEVDHEKDSPEHDALWYSIGAFAPVVNFKIADHWQPKNSLVWAYLRTDMIAGWVLVSFSVAALS
jgi:hypothetical protein